MMRHVTLARTLLSAVAVCCFALPAAAQSGAPAWLGEMDYLYWNAHRSSTPFSGELTFGADAASFANGLAETEYDWNGGYRLGVGRRCAGGLDIMFRFTSFQTNGNAALGDSTVDSDAYFANHMDRSLAQLVDRDFDDGIVDYAQESIDLEHYVYDLEFGKSYQNSCCWIRPFGGFRFAQIRQGSSVLYQNLEGTELDSYILGSDVDMSAWGLRAGAESSLSLGDTGLSVFGRAGVSLMMARFRVSRTDTANNQPADTTQSRQYRHNYEATIPQLDLALGVRYEHGCFFVASGYEISQWFNMYQHLDVVGYDDVDRKTVPIRADRGDLGLDGLFLRAGMVY